MTLGELEAAEVAGWRDTWAAAPAGLAGRAGIVHEQHGELLATTVTSAPGRLTTHVLGLTDQTPDRRAALARAEAFCRRHGVPTLVAAAEGAAVEAELAGRGYVQDRAWVKFARDVAPAAPVACDLAIRPVAPRDAARMGDLVAAGFFLPAGLAPWFAALAGRPRWHVLGAYDGDELVATGSLFAHGATGWVTWGATAARHRGRRAQKALLAARIDLARTLGLRALVTETGEPEPGGPDASYRNILGAGFTIAGRRPFWRLDTPASAEDEAASDRVASTGGAPA